MKKEIEKIIKEIGNDDKVKFAVFCIERIIDLYKNVDENEDISIVDKSLHSGEAFKNLKMIFNEVKNRDNLCENRLNELLDICDPLILDIEEVFDNTVENVVASIVAQSVDYLIRFYLEKDENYIYYCSSNNIEILNQIKSDEYSKKIDPNADNDEIAKYLNTFFNNEYNLQIQALNLILNGNNDLLSDLVKNEHIEFMKSEIKKLIIKLSEIINDDDFIYNCEEIVDQLIDFDEIGDSIPSILELMENNPKVDFGLPGPLVHFVERFYKNGYEEHLYKSIIKSPTMHTLWMMNRVINGSDKEEKKKLVELLSNICSNESIDTEIRNYACELYEFQK